MITLLRSVVGSILEFIYPPLCLACSALLPNTSTYVCDKCRNALVRSSDHPHLTAEVSGRLGDAVDGVRASFVFQKSGPLQSLVHSLKYENMEQVGGWLGEQLGDELVRTGVRPDFLIPVPLHRVKERERGYNQAALIAEGCALRTGGVVVAHAIRRTRHTRTQTKLSIEERNANVASVFTVDPVFAERVSGTTVMVVDDVITTGATIGACARVLRAAGAGHVLAGAAAVADHAA